MDLNLNKLTDMAQPLMDKVSEVCGQDLNALVEQYKGKPVTEIIPEVKRVLEQHNLSFSQEDLTKYAQKISEGVSNIFG